MRRLLVLQPRLLHLQRGVHVRMPAQSEPDDNVPNYVPGHAWIITFNGPQRVRVCYHCNQEERTAPRTCWANEEWTVIE